MPPPSDSHGNTPEQSIVGLGASSIRKSYWRQFRRSVADLERFRLLLDRAQDLILLVDTTDETIIDVTASCVRLGWKPEQLLGQPVSVLLGDAWKSRNGDPNLGQGGGVLVQLKQTDGSVTTLELGCDETHLDGRKYAVVVGRDVSQRMAAEAALAATVEELSRSNLALERFAQIASHDLQEPVRTIVSFAQLLERQLGGALPADAKESLDYLTHGAKRMQDLVSDLLEYSRVSDRLSQYQPVDMNAVFDEVLAALHESIAENGARITAVDLPTIIADRWQMHQLLQNLIGNAIKFHRPNVPPEIRVSAERKADEWWFAVADNGIGIEAGYLSRLFQVFLRLHTIDAYPGTGIGLAICKAVVERHKGRIWIESVPGQGSTVTFTLPVTPSADA
ncbi:MAG: sensor histidine kinase [Bacteroidota bacterium]